MIHSRDCPKTYHPSCLENKHGFLPSPDEEFICDWHTCFKSMKKNKKTYIGWGSDKLMYFLSTLGKETSKSCDEDELVEVVMAYIKQKNLFDNNKNRTFLCDDVLHPLFGRRKVRCKSIRRFLARHLSANVVSEDETFDGSEDDDIPVTKKKPRFDGSEDGSVGIMRKEPWGSLELKIDEKVSERNKRRFASLNENNIKLIYLRRSLIINLSKHPDTFEQKVVGCFVRVKNAPSVHIYGMPKMPFLLGLVTGIKRSTEEYKINDIHTNILLCVTGFWDDVRISMLSDGDIDEEECNGLVSLVKKGLLERPTIAALEEKVAIVHKGIVNHWIDKQLVRLDREIDRANIKGWRAEFDEKLRQLKLLSTEAERMRLLEEVPDIIADIEEEGNESELEVIADIEEEGNESELEVAASNSSQKNAGETNTSLPPFYVGAKQPAAKSVNDLQEDPPKGAAEDVDESLRAQKEKQNEGKKDSASCFMEVTENSKGNRCTFLPCVSSGAKQVANSLNGHQEEPTKAENVPKCLRAYEEKPIEGDTNTLLPPSSPGVTQSASSSNDLQVQPTKDAADDAVKSLGVDKEKPTKVGEARHGGVTIPDSVLHSQMHNTQDPPTKVVLHQQPVDNKVPEIHVDMYSIRRCIEVISTMADLSPVEKSLAADVFLDPSNREAFLSLSADIKPLWLRRKMKSLI